MCQNARARLIAFYLPQFHPIPENDVWWGNGFTEWANVARAKPLFRGHRQPTLPGELGFYDLRVPEIRQAQADLAREHGIEGFCYWHYWFTGKRLLDRPLGEVFESGQPDFPFCLAWANESWSRSWMGDNTQLLIEQRYSYDDDVAHARWFAPMLADPRYIRIRGRPIILVYRPAQFPEPRRTTDTFREEIIRTGLPEPYLVGINAHSRHIDMRDLGFDITEHHEPQLGVLPGAFNSGPIFRRIARAAMSAIEGRPRKVYAFAEARRLMDGIRPPYPHIPAYFVGWDNSPRRGSEAIIIHGADPSSVGQGLRRLVALQAVKPSQERLIFLNAWNEWAEGMYLEPDQERGRVLLEAVRDAVSDGAREE